MAPEKSETLPPEGADVLAAQLEELLTEARARTMALIEAWTRRTSTASTIR